MTAKLHAFSLYSDPLSEAFPFCLPATSSSACDMAERLVGTGLTTPASQDGNERRLTGLIVSALVECELLAFLQEGRRRGVRNYRNGYIERTLKTDVGDVDVQVSRDRAGAFEPQLVGRYERTFETATSDLLALAVADGYTEEERRLFLESPYASSVLSQSMKETVFNSAVRHFEKWNDSESPQFIRVAAGWAKRVQHKNGVEKLILGITGLDERKRLVGVRALAGNPSEVYSLVDRLVSETAAVQGVVMPSCFLMPCGVTPFAEAVKRYWPSCSVLEDAA